MENATRQWKSLETTAICYKYAFYTHTNIYKRRLQIEIEKILTEIVEETEIYQMKDARRENKLKTEKKNWCKVILENYFV